jgi:hypothetical protein
MDPSSSSVVSFPSEERFEASGISEDRFSKLYFFAIPWTVPVIVGSATFLFSGVGRTWIWIPLLLIYWGTIWGFTLHYRHRRGGVFERERFRLTFRLRGETLWLQYLLVYGPLVWAVPIWVASYLPHLTLNMALVMAVGAAVNGPSEEIFWRACLEDAGKAAGVSQRKRLVLGPIMFSLWHTAFVLHIFPLDETWIRAWAATILATWISGTIWMWVLHRSGRLFPQCFYHSCANFLSVFPMIAVTVLHVSF